MTLLVCTTCLGLEKLGLILNRKDPDAVRRHVELDEAVVERNVGHLVLDEDLLSGNV
jgi:hypothetical protein